MQTLDVRGPMANNAIANPARQRDLCFRFVVAGLALALGVGIGRISAGVQSTPWTPQSGGSALRTQKLLLQADAVFFDVDSTIVTTEGIVILGRCFGVEKEIDELTHNTMNGNLSFEVALSMRLELLASHGMTEKGMSKCIANEGLPMWTPGIQEVIKRLHAKHVDVFLVSGGFRNMITPIAEQLDIPTDMVYANVVLFRRGGQYAGFDRTAPTCRSDGKPKVLQKVQKEMGYKTMIMVGDGATDLAARTQGPASAFIGYGGVVARASIKEHADWFIYSFNQLLEILPLRDTLLF